MGFILKISFTLVTQQATLIRRSIVPSLPLQLVFPVPMPACKDGAYPSGVHPSWPYKLSRYKRTSLLFFWVSDEERKFKSINALTSAQFFQHLKQNCAYN